MEVYCRGKAVIRDIKDGKIYEIDCSDLDWDQVGGDERDMGLEIHYEAMLEHPELGTLTWGIWEYPIGIENYQSTDAGDHKVISDFDYGLEHDVSEAYEDDWLNYDPPSSPYTVFLNSYHQLSDLLEEHGELNGNGLINRMIFANLVTALEAYLCDTLVKEVMANKEPLEQLITKADELVNTKVSLSEISRSPNIVLDTAVDYLRSVLYHNLAKVDKLYKIALGFGILTLAKDKESLFKAILLRHDCVHRNGYDKKGNELIVFTKSYVDATGKLIRELVEGIQNNFSASF